jgi:hypothetical protein
MQIGESASARTCVLVLFTADKFFFCSYHSVADPGARARRTAIKRAARSGGHVGSV